MLGVEGIVEDQPLAGVIVGTAGMALAWAWWFFFPRYESGLRRVPGNLGRLPSALFIGVIGGITFVWSVISMFD